MAKCIEMKKDDRKITELVDVSSYYVDASKLDLTVDETGFGKVNTGSDSEEEEND